MAIRRPKKMNRPSGASSALRLGPGMETTELRFSPEGGWEVAGEAAAAARRRSTTLPPRWVISWEVGPGATVDRGLKLARLHCVGVDKDGGPGNTKEHFIVAPREGILTEILVPTGAQVSPGNSPTARTGEDYPKVPVGRISFCGHPELHGTLCTSCGRNIRPNPTNGRREDGGGGGGSGSSGTAGGNGGGSRNHDEGNGGTHQVLMKGGKMMSVTAEGRRMMHINKSGRLLNSKKLSLVLDLDNTLLHCSDHPDAGRVVVPGVDGIHSLRLPNHPRDYYIKLRPGLRRFLAQASTMFEMTIYTAGTSQYADAVASVLDPDRSLFQGRHFSTCFTPDLGRNTKSLERIFPNGLDMALIVDDRDDVWRGEQAKNLLLVRPYKFFVGQRSVPGGPTHDPGPQAAAPRPAPAPAPAPAPVPVPIPSREHSKLPERSELSSPAAQNGSEPVRANAGAGLNGDVGHHAGGDSNAKVTVEGSAREGHGATQTTVATAATGAKAGAADGSGESAKAEPDAEGKEVGAGAGGGSSLGVSREEESAPREQKERNIEVERVVKPRQQDNQQERPPPVPPGAGTAAPSGGGGEASSSDGLEEFSSKSQVASLGQGLARLLEEQRRENGEGKRKDCEEEAAATGPADLEKAKVVGDTQRGDAGSADSQRPPPPPRVAQASGVPGSRDKEAHPGTAGNGVTKECEVTPKDNSTDGATDSSGGAVERSDDWLRGSHPSGEAREGAGSNGSSSEVAVSKSSGGGLRGGGPLTPTRREMLAPPMSPPKVVASAENDPQLDCTFKTLEAVHGAFYAPENSAHGQRRAAADFLAKVRLRVLRGVRMVFSGVIPVSGAPADPRTHRLWKMAESHGATVESAIGRDTTHVVAVRLGTAKTKAGLRMPGVFVVHLDWLMNSIWHCRRERETMFLLAGQICGGEPPPMPAPLPPLESAAPPSSSSSSNEAAREARRITGGGEEVSDRSTASTTGSESGDGSGGGVESAKRTPDSGKKVLRKRQREDKEEEEEEEDAVDDDEDVVADRASLPKHGAGVGGVSSRRSAEGWRDGGGGCRSPSANGSTSSSGSSGSGDEDGSGSSVGSDLDGLVDELENSL